MAKRGHLSANELRSDFDVEPQEAAPFSDTFHNNLLLTAPQAIFAQVVQEAKEE